MNKNTQSTQDSLKNLLSALVDSVNADVPPSLEGCSIIRETISKLVSALDRLELTIRTGAGNRKYEVVFSRWDRPYSEPNGTLEYASITLEWAEPVCALSDADFGFFNQTALATFALEQPERQIGANEWDIGSVVEIPPVANAFFPQPRITTGDLQVVIDRAIRDFPTLYLLPGQEEVSRLRVLNHLFLGHCQWLKDGTLEKEEYDPRDRDSEENLQEELKFSRLIYLSDGYWRPPVSIFPWHNLGTLVNMPITVQDDYLLGAFEILDHALTRPYWELGRNESEQRSGREKLEKARQSLVARFGLRLTDLGMIREMPMDPGISPAVGISINGTERQARVGCRK